MNTPHLSPLVRNRFPLIAAIIAAIAFFFVITANNERSRKFATLITYLAITGTIVISASNAIQYGRTLRNATAASLTSR